MHESEMVQSTSNKIIQGDWNWPYDREDTWHGQAGEGRHIMLYGDMHVENLSSRLLNKCLIGSRLRLTET